MGLKDFQYSVYLTRSTVYLALHAEVQVFVLPTVLYLDVGVTSQELLFIQQYFRGCDTHVQ